MVKINFNGLNMNWRFVAISGAVASVIVLAGMWSMGAKTGSVLSIDTAHAETTKTVPRWAASATGRIEPVSGQVRLMPEVSGQIKEVLAKTNDKVLAGDLLVTLDEGDLPERLSAAAAEVDVRKREREEEPPEGLAKDRQAASDKVAEAERALFSAWRAFDKAVIGFKKGDAADYAVTSARDAINRTKKKLEKARSELAELNDNPEMPFLTRLESSLEQARSDLAMVEYAYERTRVRAPFNGTVLNVLVNAGDMASPTSGQPLLAFGDISKLRVRAEVEERDVAKVRIGQKVIVRADGFPDREFEGTVTEIASALGVPRIATRGPRRPNDVDVLEVVAELDGSPPLLTGMRVDVFFKRLEGDARN